MNAIVSILVKAVRIGADIAASGERLDTPAYSAATFDSYNFGMSTVQVPAMHAHFDSDTSLTDNLTGIQPSGAW